MSSGECSGVEGEVGQVDHDSHVRGIVPMHVARVQLVTDPVERLTPRAHAVRNALRDVLEDEGPPARVLVLVRGLDLREPDLGPPLVAGAVARPVADPEMRETRTGEGVREIG